MSYSDEITYDSAAMTALDEVVRSFQEEIIRIAEINGGRITEKTIFRAATIMLSSGSTEWTNFVPDESVTEEVLAEYRDQYLLP